MNQGKKICYHGVLPVGNTIYTLSDVIKLLQTQFFKEHLPKKIFEQELNLSKTWHLLLHLHHEVQQ
jgi:hypothetical protein